MFRIRRIFDDSLPIDRAQLGQVRQILRVRFPGAPATDTEHLVERLQNPVRYKFRSFLFVADDAGAGVKGFALVFHDRDLGFLYLDYLATAADRVASGVGGALYARVREEGQVLGTRGVFFECLPDDRAQCTSDAQYRENVARLRFYERFGALPIVETKYETPVTPGDKGAPYLVYDGLDRRQPLRRRDARAIVRAILERKYGDLCPPEYVRAVVESFRSDPVVLRPHRHVKSRKPPVPRDAIFEPVALVCNTGHDIHHVRDRGYVESPVRIAAIQRHLDASGLFHPLSPGKWAEKHITAVHDPDFYRYLKRVCAAIPPGSSVYPYVFPVRNQARPPKELPIRAGYYCIDTFTPLNKNAFLAARGAVSCSLTAAGAILSGDRIAYALVRPPGHHAEYRSFGGFCYFNNAAVAAHYLSTHGRVAILDVDYHHGNGQQDIFWKRADVLTVSIHGHPRFAYPYFSGFAEEIGGGDGEGYNLNIPLPESMDGDGYRRALARATKRVREFDPRFLVVALGLDPARGDPTGSWSLVADDFLQNGRMIGDLSLPTVVIQEGGYRTRTLGVNARNFFEGLVQGTMGHSGGPTKKARK